MTVKRELQGQFNAWVLAGGTKEERRKRLLEIPEDMRKKAEQHVKTVFAVRNHHGKNKK